MNIDLMHELGLISDKTAAKLDNPGTDVIDKLSVRSPYKMWIDYAMKHPRVNGDTRKLAELAGYPNALKALGVGPMIADRTEAAVRVYNRYTDRIAKALAEGRNPAKLMSAREKARWAQDRALRKIANNSEVAKNSWTRDRIIEALPTIDRYAEVFPTPIDAAIAGTPVTAPLKTRIYRKLFLN